MKEMSPITREIVKAFEDRYELCGPFDGNWVELCLSATFQVLADRVTPKSPFPAMGEDPWLNLSNLSTYIPKQELRLTLLGMVEELENSDG
jgi:hypothetical protein